MLFTLTVWHSMLRVSDSRLRKASLVLGLVVDLAVLGYFKYFIFVTDSINSLVGATSMLYGYGTQRSWRFGGERDTCSG